MYLRNAMYGIQALLGALAFLATLAPLVPSRADAKVPTTRTISGRHGVAHMPDSDTRSMILRSTHILLVKVIDANVGPWAPSRPGLKSRRVDLTLQVVQTLRGMLVPLPREHVRLMVEQTDYADLLMMQPLTGVWSRLALTPGSSWVIFSQGAASDVAHVLAEPAVIRVSPADSVLPGLRIAVAAETQTPSLKRTLELAAPETPHLDPMFGEYLWERYGAGAIASQADFDALMAFAERKGFVVGTRQALLLGGYHWVGLHGEETPARAQRLALAMFRSLLMPEAADLHENLIDTYLPNLLGIASDLPHQTAVAVFVGHAAERDAVRAALRHYGTDIDAKPLLDWLDGR